MMSMQSSTHSSQMNTVGPAISLRTSCCDLPQNEQYRVFLESPGLLMRTPPPDAGALRGILDSPSPPPQGQSPCCDRPMSKSRWCDDHPTTEFLSKGKRSALSRGSPQPADDFPRTPGPESNGGSALG